MLNLKKNQTNFANNYQQNFLVAEFKTASFQLSSKLNEIQERKKHKLREANHTANFREATFFLQLGSNRQTTAASEASEFSINKRLSFVILLLTALKVFVRFSPLFQTYLKKQFEFLLQNLKSIFKMQ